MVNITKNQRNEQTCKIDELETYLKKNSAPEQFLQILNGIKQENAIKKYGLVFEDHIEEVTEMNNAKLVEQRSLSIENGGQINQLIEGENLIALKLLKESHYRKIDVICIDPPYNTGMNSLNYNDYDYIDKEDSYIHSKWLSFMKNRLDIAYELLSNNGVMFINIDENEIATLLLSCHQLFGEKNVDVLIWPKTDPRFDQNRVGKNFHNIKMVHEYVLVCFKDKTKTHFNKIMLPTLIDGGWVDLPVDMETIIKGLGTTSSAKDEISDIFGDRYRFQTPKPVRLIKEFIRAASKPDSIILDFFAGSGTAGIAVMDLNKEDNGNRIFILVTNNENEICRDITYARLRKSIESEYYQASIKYYKIL